MPPPPRVTGHHRGFTLIEVSIVLVIIALIIGGILVGQDLINAAAIRQQISQIDQFNSAANTFKSKYGGIPGDLVWTTASQLGFTSRTGVRGQGDGSGLIEGYDTSLGAADGVVYGGESELFWSDLAAATLIPGSYNNPAAYVSGSSVTSANNPNYFPQAKIGSNLYVYIFGTGGTADLTVNPNLMHWANYYGIEAMASNNAGQVAPVNTNGKDIPVYRAYAIDYKIDDGEPTTGIIQAAYMWLTNMYNSPSAHPATATSCYDSTTLNYATSYNYGYNANCGMVIKAPF